MTAWAGGTLCALVVSAAFGFLAFQGVRAFAGPGGAASRMPRFNWSRPFAGFGKAILGFFPAWRARWGEHKRLEALKALFPQSLGMALQALKTGQTLPQTLEYLAKESPSPLRDEWQKACAEMDLGASAEQALTHLGERHPGFTDFHAFVQSYKISRQTGANLTHLVKVLLEGMDTRARLARKLDSMTAQARLSGILMGLLPPALLAVFFIMDPTILEPLVTQKAGWGILLLAAGMETIGFLWIKRLLRKDFQ